MRKLVNVAVGSLASFGHQPVTSGPRPKQRTSFLAGRHVSEVPILLKKSKIERLQKSRKC